MTSMWNMRNGRARLFGLVSVAALLTLAACAKSTVSGSGGGTSNPTSGSGAVTVSTASVAGVGTVLVDSKGFTLYYLKSEPTGTITCTGSCATNWPPLLLPAGTMSASAGTGVSDGDLATIARPDGGTQVTYKGMALYLFAGDQSAGQANGQGTEDFFAVTTSGSASSGGSGGGGGYGGGGGGGGGY
jgi:predicted lipoprotein with Yx(FWY)xxD motif